MVIAPIQQFGIGDILFTMPIFQEFIEQGHHVLWGVQSQYLSIAKHFPNVTFVDKSVLTFDVRRNDEYLIGNTRVIPLRFTDSIIGLPYNRCMESKYLYFGKDFNEWRKLVWERDWENEEKLFTELGLKTGEEYNLISKTFRGNFTGKSEIEVDNGLKNIYLENLEGYSLLDWGTVIEQATNIHAVCSSINYILEMLNLCAKEVHLYLRLPDEKDYRNIEYLLTKDYIFH